MKDQINYLTGIGVSAVNISSKDEVDRPAVQRVEAIRCLLLYLKRAFKIMNAFKLMKDGETEVLRKHACRENLNSVSVNEADVFRQ